MHEVKYLRDQNGRRASNLLDSTQAGEYMGVLVGVLKEIFNLVNKKIVISNSRSQLLFVLY